MTALPLLLTAGDPAGVGPEIALAAAARCTSPCVLFGDGARLASEAARLGVGLADGPGTPGLALVDTGPVAEAAVAARAPTAEGGRAQLAALDEAARWMLAGRGRALVTGPTSKEAIELAGTPFTGQTEHLARHADVPSDGVTMLFLGPRLRVGLVTTHLALRALPGAITARRVERAVRHLVEALERLPGVPARPRVVITGLNPHAGEGGLFGPEERDMIGPALVGLRRAGDLPAELEGPQGAETAFRRAAAQEVDGVVAMFHDQATIASKLLDWGAAVNVTWGLPFLRTSVDHGVAYDAVGRASPEGMTAAVELALALTPGP